MSIALLVSSETDLQEQSLIFPYTDGIRVYYRTSNGQAGRGQSWTLTLDIDSLPDTPLTHSPVAVVLTDRDLELVRGGLVTNIGAKALYALESAEPITAPSTHRQAVTDIVQRLTDGDQTLSEYITDKRRSQGVIISAVTLPAEPKREPVKVEFVQETSQAPSNSQLAYENMISIPDPKWARDYINRHFENGLSDFEVYDYALENNLNVLVEGGAGSGKTMSVIAYASARGKRYFNVSSSQGLDPSQLFGRWIPREDGHGYRWQDGAVTLLVRHGGVLLLNEVNFMPERIMTVLYSLLDDRREIQLLDNGGEVIKAHPNLLIVADMNHGYRGTHELSQANNDRWALKLEFPYDKKIEARLIKSKSLLELARSLREMFDREEIVTPISTRGLVAFQRNAIGLGIDFAITSYVNGFDKEERGAVRLAIETLKVNISRDYGLAVPEYLIDSTLETTIEQAETEGAI
jgi:AAA domain (dynein-related subfamily)